MSSVWRGAAQGVAVVRHSQCANNSANNARCLIYTNMRLDVLLCQLQFTYLSAQSRNNGVIIYLGNIIYDDDGGNCDGGSVLYCVQVGPEEQQHQ